MNGYTLLLFAVGFCTALPVYADRVFVVEGAGRTRSGKVTAVTCDGVTIEMAASPSASSSSPRSETVPANQIVYTTFDDDPPRLLNVRTAVAAGRWNEARDELGKVVVPETVSELTKQDHRFLAFTISARRALEAADVAKPESRDTLTQAASQGIAFIADFPQSYHYYAVCRTTSDILALLGDTESLERTLQLMAAAPWNEERLYAAVALGDIAFARGDVAAARKHLSGVVMNTETTPQIVVLQRRAAIGLARCLVKEAKWDEAETELNNLIARVDRESPGDAATLASLFNTLGDTLRDKGSAGEAVLAYLHTELLYNSARPEWLYALRQLEELWRQLDKPDRAVATATKLQNALKETKP
ncbi:MAG: tetratricopeptide repeat protein [Thermoguttaceae bacterium]